MRIPRLAILLILVAVLAACQQEAAAPQAPTLAEAQDAISAHLSKRGDLAMDRMDIEVSEVTADGEEYIAQAVFRTKDGQGEMPVNYRLVHEGDSWMVKASEGPGSHQGIPEGHPTPGAGAQKDPSSSH